MLRIIRSNIQKVFYDPGFVISVVFAFLLCSSAVIYVDPKNYNEYSAFSALFSFGRDDMLCNISFSSIEVLRCCGTGWLIMFVPMAAAFTWIRLFCAERHSGAVRFEILRENRLSYCLSKIAVGCLSGGTVMLLGFLLYAAAVFLLYPNFSSYAPSMQESQVQWNQMIYGESVSVHFSEVLRQTALRMFLLGITATIPVIAIAGIADSPYSALCIPFFLNYAVTQTITKLQNNVSSVTIQRFLMIIKPGALLYLSGNEMLYIILLRCVLILIGAGLFTLIQFKRVDQGA